MASKNLINVLAMSKRYNVRASTFFDITDEYTAYCFDEACSYVLSQLEQGKEPHYKVKAKSFGDFYANILQ